MTKGRSRIYSMILVALFCALIIVGAFIRIPIPVVPFTLQFLFTTLAGTLLGSKRGFLSVAIYILLGLAGVPVFTGGGGITYALYPTFGYLVGFALGAFSAGLIVERRPNCSYWRILVACLVNLVIVYAVGLPYVYCIQNFYALEAMTVKTLLVTGFLMTAPVDVVLCFLCAAVTKRLAPVLRRGYQYECK